MSPDVIKFRLSDYFWPFGFSLLTGLVGLYLATVGLFALGVLMTRWHSLVFFVFAGVIAWFSSAGPAAVRFRAVMGLLLIQAGLICLLAMVAMQFDDLTEDGMGARIEPVLALASGWNPILDQQGVTLESLALEHPALKGGVQLASNNQTTMGSVLSAHLVQWAGNLNAGKAITPILALASFGIAFGGMSSLLLPGGWCLTLALMATLNPVVLYQSSSFYIDGQNACLFAALTFLCLRPLAGLKDGAGLFAAGLAFVGLAATKTSGLYYGGIILTIFLVFHLWARPREFWIPLLGLVGGLLIAWPCATVLRSACKFPFTTKNYIQTVTGSGPGYGYGGGASAIKELPQMSKLSAFVTSHFAPCDSIPDRIKTKFPFYFNRRELALFEDLSPDARAGGFGPLYGGCLLLALGSLAVLFVSEQKPLPAALFPIVPVLISTGLSQTWWARWVSQAWLIPVCLLLPVLTCLRNQPPGFRWVPAFLCLFTGLLNSFLILAFYTSGCLKSQRVLDSQLAFLKSLPQPLSVHMSRFPSNRLWFQREGIDFRTVENPPSAPRLRMFRTDTTVALPEGWKNTPAAVGLVASWKKMRLLQE